MKYANEIDQDDWILYRLTLCVCVCVTYFCHKYFFPFDIFPYNINKQTWWWLLSMAQMIELKKKNRWFAVWHEKFCSIFYFLEDWISNFVWFFCLFAVSCDVRIVPNNIRHIWWLWFVARWIIRPEKKIEFFFRIL